MYKKDIKRGFTLAETLITLVIIGVVAAITVPSLIANYRANQLESQFKKGVSNLSNAVRMMQIKEPYWYQNIQGWVSDDLNSGGTGNSGANHMGDLLRRSFKNVKEDLSTGGGRNYSRQFGKYYKNKQNTLDLAGTDAWGVFGSFDTLDGMTIYPECSGGCNNIHIFIDVNGFNKKPNRAGVDLFDFQIEKKTGSLIPSTQFGTDCSRDDKYAGFDCTRQAMYEKDYFKHLH